MMRLLLSIVICSCASASSLSHSDGGDQDASSILDGSRSLDAPHSVDARPPDAPRTDAGSTAITLTQVSTNTLAANSLACANDVSTSEQAYYRVFDLATIGITSTLTISSVAFGVQTETGTQTITVNVGTYSTAPAPTLDVGSADWGSGDVTAIATTTTNVVAAASGTIVSVPITASIPGSSYLILEIRSPDSSTDAFFLGASTGTETAAGFFWAPTCGDTPPGTPASEGEGTVPFVITASGTY
jgi:hypothetical protein